MVRDFAGWWDTLGHVAPLSAELAHGAALSWRRGLTLMLGSWCRWLGHVSPPPRGLPSRVPWTALHGRCPPGGRVRFCKISSGPDPEVTEHRFYHILLVKGSQGLARFKGGRNGWAKVPRRQAQRSAGEEGAGNTSTYYVPGIVLGLGNT